MARSKVQSCSPGSSTKATIASWSAGGPNRNDLDVREAVAPARDLCADERSVSGHAQAADRPRDIETVERIPETAWKVPDATVEWLALALASMSRRSGAVVSPPLPAKKT